jgi:hypothetical protein
VRPILVEDHDELRRIRQEDELNVGIPGLTAEVSSLLHDAPSREAEKASSLQIEDPLTMARDHFTTII